MDYKIHVLGVFLNSPPTEMRKEDTEAASGVCGAASTPARLPSDERSSSRGREWVDVSKGERQPLLQRRSQSNAIPSPFARSKALPTYIMFTAAPVCTSKNTSWHWKPFPSCRFDATPQPSSYALSKSEAIGVVPVSLIMIKFFVHICSGP